MAFADSCSHCLWHLAPELHFVDLDASAGIEVACNLVSSGQKQPDPEEVRARVTQLASEQSIPVGSAYRIGKSLQELVDEASEQLPEES